ncbi:MAG: hypothetical protein ACP5XB_30065 [Isosphaeraceae bacterium]
MRTKPFWLWAGAFLLTLAGAASIARSGGNEGRAANADQRFIRVGDYYINASRIDYVVREPDGLLVVFGSEAETKLKLTGPAAQEMQRWLEGCPVAREKAQPGGHTQQGESPSQMGPQGKIGPQNPAPQTGPQGRGAPGPASGHTFLYSAPDGVDRTQQGGLPQGNNPPGPDFTSVRGRPRGSHSLQSAGRGHAASPDARAPARSEDGTPVPE